MSSEGSSMKTIDLRRDTITLPDQTMRTEAFKAPLGGSVRAARSSVSSRPNRWNGTIY
jgi:hypothetical protein